MEISDKEKAEFLKKFGQNAEGMIYQRFKSKEQFLRETGFYVKNLHDILTGKCDLRATTIQRLARALGVKPKDLFPDDIY